MMTIMIIMVIYGNDDNDGGSGDD